MAEQSQTGINEMQQFTKKPVTITAVQWTGKNLKEVLEFTGKHPQWSEWFSSFDEYEKYVKKTGNIFRIIEITTNQQSRFFQPLNYWHEAYVGDWIIRGDENQYYPCKPDIFEATYDPVEVVQDG